ncbi:hypothetical protein NPIL_143151 [Nephila pilipes]|uniref:Uncharacterized protein n=1 Tax=Nephila pilipes TaxID=299642 RepID=A0A8X6P6D3_NEPPI|nr:hypothetical protein NPIL_143151 [Nephila pilipes]
MAGKEHSSGPVTRHILPFFWIPFLANVGLHILTRLVRRVTTAGGIKKCPPIILKCSLEQKCPKIGFVNLHEKVSKTTELEQTLEQKGRKEE